MWTTTDTLIAVSVILFVVGIFYFRHRSIKRSKIKGDNWVDDPDIDIPPGTFDSDDIEKPD